MIKEKHNILVVDTATQQYAYLVSKTRPFRINEILTVEDNSLQYPKCEIIETSSLNRNYAISNNDIKIVDDNVIKNLKLLDLDINEDTIHIAKVRFLNELIYPITVGAKARLLEDDEIEDIYIKGNINKSFHLGVYNSTEELFPNLDDKYRNLFSLFDKYSNNIKPLDRIPFVFPFRQLDEYPHIQITGGSGSGKSFFLRALCEEIMQQTIPAICLDPHFELDFSKTMKNLPKEYQRNFDNKYVILKAGKDICINFSDINAGELVKLISANSREFSEHMENAIYSTFEYKLTDNLYVKKLEDIREALEMTPKQLEESSNDQMKMYKERYASLNPKTIEAVIRRIRGLQQQQLFGSQGFERVVDELLQGKLVIIQGKIKYLRMFSGFMIDSLYKKRRNYRDNIQDTDNSPLPFPGFIVAVDEAHNFAPNSSDDIIPSKYIIREIAQEGRKYGVFLALATQRPSLLDSTTQAQINTKFIFRTTRMTDIDNISNETDLSKEDIKRLPYLQSGNCFISSPILGRTIFAQIRCTYTESPHSENSFDETYNMINKSGDNIFDLIQDFLPITTYDFTKIISKLNNMLPKEYNHPKLESELDTMVLRGKLLKTEDFMGNTTYSIRVN
jgi:DNA helicase HerA-like ATPase